MKQCFQNSEEKIQSKILYPAKLFIKNENRINTFSNFRTLKIFIFQIPFLRKLKKMELEKMLQQNEKEQD